MASGSSSSGGAAGISSISSRTQLPACMRAVGHADGLPVPQHPFARRQVFQSDLVRLRNPLARDQPVGQKRTCRRTLRMHQNGNIVAGVNANIH